MQNNQSQSNDMSNSSIRESVFKGVFNTDAGKLVLNYLTELYEIKNPDTSNPNQMFFELGRQAAIRQIKLIITKGL